jgi:hypothetical protein
MHRYDLHADPARRLRVAALAVVAALALTAPAAHVSLAVAPDGGSLPNGTPLVAEPGLTTDGTLSGTLNAAPQAKGSTDGAGGAAAADSADGTNSAGAAVAPVANSIVRPTRVWTTDRYGYRRSTFQRGELIAFWVQLYNPSYQYAYHPLELWADDQIRCITAPCPGGPQRLFAGTVRVRPGSTNFYVLARSEYSDKVGEWSYYATDPAGETFLATKFYLR